MTSPTTATLGSRTPRTATSPFGSATTCSGTSVYAPGWDVEDDAQERRDHYDTFTATLVHLDDVIDDEISEFEPWVPDAWIVSDEAWFYEEPDRDWPLDAPTGGECVVLPSEDGENTATGAYLARDGTIVVAHAVLPGAECVDVTTTTPPTTA